ncbi:Acetyl-coenzyme A synthetase [Roseovarius gaetbuli]|uniref:Acetyl-coenzyme A synthetase n=1 Tax=Roseovarius gaetbuli TaxID=1356575 RepID=A0A1X6YCW9_9RHOB|nr:AMP-binding protein [Roseovarius gaetbuli]SLN15793.1 Acetyl-coenzyme A synthetase [Roseovarius gaetbuli]
MTEMRPTLQEAPYAALCDGFAWDIPARLNMAVQVCDDWATRMPEQVAIVDLSGEGARDITYGELRSMADRLALALVARGVTRGDRVGVLRSQGAWCAAAHIAIWKIGAISIPLFKLFKHDALSSRVGDAGARVIVTDADGVGLLAGLAQVEALVPEACALPDGRYETVDTGAEEPAVLIYTSGTTGAPKGALHGHRVLMGHLPGVEISHDFLGQPGDCLWTPADWAWIGGLFDVLMPGLAIGVPVVAARMAKFGVDDCMRIIRKGHVKNVFFPPTALRLLKAQDSHIAGLRSVASGGEPLGAEMLDWGRRAFGLMINEFYGQTECNMVASSCAALFSPKPGCLGKAVPGHDLAVLDENGAPTQAEGDVAIRRGSASMMLEYWNKPEQTAEKFHGDWMLTGDRGIWEDDYLRFVGREDDVITSAGYRIGPAEIEDCLLTHNAVATVGVVGKPDPVRTEIVKAYVVLKPGIEASVSLAAELQAYVKERLATYSYPREISFIEALPMTVTGKVIRKDLKARAAAEVAQ